MSALDDRLVQIGTLMDRRAKLQHFLTVLGHYVPDANPGDIVGLRVGQHTVQLPLSTALASQLQTAYTRELVEVGDELERLIGLTTESA